MNKVNIDKIKKSKQKNLDRLGETRIMSCGELAFIIEYNNYTDITIQFKNTCEIIKCSYSDFERGLVKSHFTPTVYGVGITGLEETRDSNGEKVKSYVCWTSMLQRCYSYKFQSKYESYKDCVVCDEWLYYSNFKKWYSKNYYEIEGQKMNLDKDILVKGNKVYSPETCVFVSQDINKLFIKSNKSRGILPIGVIYDNKKSEYYSLYSDLNGKQIKSKYYKYKEDAFLDYKHNKENTIKEMIVKYKDCIPYNLSKAMSEYEVNIND